MVGEPADVSFVAERSKQDIMQSQLKYIGLGLKNDAKRSSWPYRSLNSALYSILRQRLDSYGTKGCRSRC